MTDITTLVTYQEADDATGTARTVIQRGDTVTSFRGDPATFVTATRESMPGRSGKVLVDLPNGDRREYNDRVYGLTVVAVLACGCPTDIVADEGHQEGCAERA